MTAELSKVKRAALRRLHAARRGKRRNAIGMPEHTFRGLLADLMTALREPEPNVRSIRTLARHCEVAPRTVSRWLDGTDWPPAHKVRRLQSFLRRLV